MFWHMIVAHRIAIEFIGAWLFSAACSAMPPLPENSGYFATWGHNLLQSIAANPNKIRPTMSTPLASPESRSVKEQ